MFQLRLKANELGCPFPTLRQGRVKTNVAASERIAAAGQSLQLARTLEEGERFRFSVGATSVLFVNLRERNAVDSEAQLIRTQADYHKAHAFYQWAIGSWGKAAPSAVPASYRPGQ